MMINTAEKAYTIESRKKLISRAIDQFKASQKQTIMIPFTLFGIGNQLYHRKIKRRIIKQEKAALVVKIVLEIKLTMPSIGAKKFYYLLKLI